MTTKHLTIRRIAVAVIASLLCCWAAWQAARNGIARTASDYANLNAQLSAADRAVQLSSSDAETHFARGIVLQRTDDYDQAKVEFERAVQLRPRDYYLWLMLGVTRDFSQDRAGALRALRQSVALAPNYAQPRWQLGNVLLRDGNLEQAFAELRKAAYSEPTILPIVIDLAWGVYQHNPQQVAAVLQPETDSSRMTLALFFAKHDQAAAAAEQFLLTRTTSDEKAEALLSELLKAKAFSEAYQVWARMRGVATTNPIGVLTDGGFEGWLAAGQKGFGWQIAPNLTNVEMSVDTSEQQSGARSLRSGFRGNSNPGSPLLTQLVLVKPLTPYRVSFAAMSRNFVSAAAPILSINDVSDPKNTLLAQSPALLTAKGDWQQFSLDITTGAATHAISVSLARQPCANDPCPAFGALWLDSFNIETR